MSAPWAFGRIAPELEASGFAPLPISLPHPSDPDARQEAARVAADLVERRRPWPRACRATPAAAPGILTATTPAVDIDVRHPELADAIDRMVVARARRRARAVRPGAQAAAGLPHRRRRSPSSRPPATACPATSPAPRPHKVEILAAGQQFVAYGVHPGTGPALRLARSTTCSTSSGTTCPS